MRYLVSNPDKIEEGFQIIKTEYNTEVGPVDIRGIGIDGETIVEVKKRKASPNDAHQLKRYIEYFQKIETKNVQGILIAPDFPEKVMKYLKENKIKAVIIPWEEVFPLIKRVKNIRLEEFLKKEKKKY